MTVAVRRALSSAWGSSHQRLLGGTTDNAKRLAIALGATRSIIRIIDRTVPPLSVDWASVDDASGRSMSYTNMKDNSIHLNPKPILDAGIDHGAALDVVIGFALHEASHSQESRDRYKYLITKKMHPNGKAIMEVPAFEPMRVAAYLWNLVEDVRIETATSANWPGFAPYFGAVLDYMWTDMRKTHELPTEYGPELKDKLRVIYLACRYPGRLPPAAMPLSGEIQWWQAWQHDYLTDAADTPTTIRRGLDHLAEDEATAKEMEAMAADEHDERQRGERLNAQIDRLMKEGTGAFELCITEGGEVIPLDAETAEAVRRYVRENLVEQRTVVTTFGAGMAPVFVSRPEETAHSRRSYVGRPDAETEAMRTALVFRASAPQHDEKLLKTGAIDDDELYRWGAGDMRVFSERVVESKPDVFMGLLVDASGSMSGEKLRIAQRLAQLFVWAVHDQEGIETAVWAHTADISAASCDVFRIWESGDPLSRLGLIAQIDTSNNRDGQALEVVVAAVAESEQPEKVVIVLSDGLPSGNGYGGTPAQQHIRAVTRWASARGVRCIQVAIDPHGLRMGDQAAMYGPENVVGFQSYAALPRQIAALLGRYM